MDYQKQPICPSCSEALIESHAALPLEIIDSDDNFGHVGSRLGCMFNPGILMNPPSKSRSVLQSYGDGTADNMLLKGEHAVQKLEAS